MVIVKQKVLTQKEIEVRAIVVKDFVRNNVREAKWSRDVRARDGNRCAECGAVHELTAHHIVGLKKLIVENGILTPEQAINCAALWDVANGITLCPACHAKRHPENH